MEESRKDLLNKLLGTREMELSDDQDNALAVFLEFCRSKHDYSTLLLTGSAGTGKTFLINSFSQILKKQGYKVILLAPTGRAAKVITKRTTKLAFTVHHHIYSVQESSYSHVTFSLKKNKEKTRTVYIIDEASMVGNKRDKNSIRGLLDDMLAFIFQDDPERKLILVGDPVQLPPVGHDESPGLSPDELRFNGGVHLFHAHLQEVKRQLADSDVLENAVRIRDAYLEGSGADLQLMPSREVQVLENPWDSLETYMGYYQDGNLDRVVFITYSNFRATKVNEAIRHNLHNTQDLLVPSDLVMVVKNNYAWGDAKKLPFIANGEMGTVRYVHNETYEELYGLKWMDVEIEFVDREGNPFLVACKVVLDLLQHKAPQLETSILYKVYQERLRSYEELPFKEAEKQMGKDPYVNALQIKYGYAITGHKSQGGQWENVIIAFEPDYGNHLPSYIRWTYTVFTRAEERVFLLGCPFVE